MRFFLNNITKQYDQVYPEENANVIQKIIADSGEKKGSLTTREALKVFGLMERKCDIEEKGIDRLV